MSTFDGAQIVHRLGDLFVGLAEAEHQARLREHARVVALRMLEHAQRLLVARARVAHRMRQASHGLDVLREHFEAGVDHRLDVREHALEIRRQRFDSRGGTRAA